MRKGPRKWKIRWKREFYSKVESFNIQICDEDSEETSNDEHEAGVVATGKDEDTGRTDDPVDVPRKMGNVELLSRVGEIAIAKRIEEGKRKQQTLFQIISMMSIQKCLKIIKLENAIRDFVEAWCYFWVVNGEQEEFDADIPIKEEQIFDNNNNDDDDQSDAEEKSDEEDQEDFDSKARWRCELSDLSILEKEENLKPHII